MLEAMDGMCSALEAVEGVCSVLEDVVCLLELNVFGIPSMELFQLNIVGDHFWDPQN